LTIGVLRYERAHTDGHYVLSGAHFGARGFKT
jgi:hypothetical protein